MTKRNTYIIVIIIVLITTAYLYFSPTTVHKEMEGLIYSFNSNFEKKTQIVIAGKSNRNVFSRDSFIGQLVVDDDLSYDIELYYEDGKLFGTITTFSEDAMLNSVGSVMATKKLDYIWITLNDINEKYGIQEGYIFSPADSKEEANELIKKELMKITQSSHIL
ncbi:hypothetical protein P4H39_19720 [Paenibacillus lautus]|uniref:hypothetical protein n=1 Tax=Paenibacillus lautus TaxID=1401 RepID=UPI002DBA77C8|nr:hypothetical protein [Paenibacillus lautus]MEC0204838.1 hypothetical protein [Paenibacillus lautus]